MQGRSGSSSKLLSREIATSLRGRTLDYLMLPFSFKEYLRLKNINYQKYLSSEEKANLLNAFGKYFSWGGYPEILLYPQESKRLINEIIEVTIFRDLMERHKIRNLKVIKLMFNYEVDFVIKKGRKITTLIQSSFDLSDYQTKERETKSLIRASKELNCPHLLIITSNEEGEEIIKDKKIKYIPIWKWLLKEPPSATRNVKI